MKLLIVEDEAKVAEVLKRGLEEAGYEADIAFDGQIGLRMAQSGEYDLILLDINLPLLNGLELCKQLRQKDEVTPVLMLTALGMSDDIVAGLETGADDYLPKPFRFNELYARIKALTRRKKISFTTATTSKTTPPPDNDPGPDDLVKKITYTTTSKTEPPPDNDPGPDDVVKIDDLQIDLDARQVKRAGKAIQLTAKEYMLLEYLAKNTGKVRSRREIAEAVWGLTFETGTNFIDVYINYLRNKIDKPFGKKLVHTVTGFGYVLKLPES